MASTRFGCAIIAVIFGSSLLVTGVPVGSTKTVSLNTTTTAENGTHQEFGSSSLVTGDSSTPIKSKTTIVSVNTTATAENGSHQELGSSSIVTGGSLVPVNSTTTSVSVNTTKSAENGTHQEL